MTWNNPQDLQPTHRQNCLSLGTCNNLKQRIKSENYRFRADKHLMLWWRGFHQRSKTSQFRRGNYQDWLWDKAPSSRTILHHSRWNLRHSYMLTHPCSRRKKWSHMTRDHPYCKIRHNCMLCHPCSRRKKWSHMLTQDLRLHQNCKPRRPCNLRLCKTHGMSLLPSCPSQKKVSRHSIPWHSSHRRRRC